MHNGLQIFSAGGGVLYAVKPDGSLVWYRNTGWDTGEAKWENNGNERVLARGSGPGSGWASHVRVVGGGQGVLYAVKPDGSLVWYRNSGWETGEPKWENGGNERVLARGNGLGSGWSSFQPRLELGSVVEADISGHYGLDYRDTPCRDVRRSVDQIDGSKKRGATPWPYQAKKRYTLGNHAQGVARLGGIGRSNWFAITRGDRSNIEFVEMGSRDGQGGRSLHVSPNIPGGSNRSRMVFDPPQHNNDHAGGVDTIGRYLFVGSDPQTRVDIYDVEPLNRSAGPTVVNTLLIDGSQGEPRIEPGGAGASAHFVGATRLRDGRYLLMVAKDDRGKPLPADHRGKKPHHAWFYVSHGTDIRNALWRYHSFWDFSERHHNRAYQSANLVVQVDGTIYVAMFRPGTAKKNYIDFWRLTVNGAHIRPVLEWERRVFEHRWWGRMTFGAGGCLHVTADSDILIYGIPKRSPVRSSRFQVEEYRAH